jgi:signal transduction histidine kinase
MKPIRHLYLKIYAAFLAIVASSLITAGVVRLAFDHDEQNYDNLARGLSQLVVKTLPTREGPELDSALEQQARELGLGLVLWEVDGRILARTSSAPQRPNEYRGKGLLKHRAQLGIVVPLRDGRQFGAFLNNPPPHGPFFLWLAFFAGVVALGCYPLARGITGRLERLQKAAQAWSQGALSVRAPIEGADEIAALSRSLNHAAERVDDLLRQQKRMLASASHELRSPLARLQMALTLLESATPQRRDELLQSAETDVSELNALIEDLLLTARAEQPPPRELRPLDLLPLVRAEAQRLELPFAAPIEAATVAGDVSMLRSLLRNLMENALRHGGGRDVTVSLDVTSGVARVVVADRGPGVPSDQTERIFEPFYRPQGHNEGHDHGVGLGLALVKQIATHHRGTARYEPRTGGGSTFIVELPTA